jgi:hypothetical protein
MKLLITLLVYVNKKSCTHAVRATLIKALILSEVNIIRNASARPEKFWGLIVFTRYTCTHVGKCNEAIALKM